MASTTVIAVPSDGTPNWLLLDGSVTEEDEDILTRLRSSNQFSTSVHYGDNDDREDRDE